MMGQRFMIKAGEPMGQWLTRNWNGYPSWRFELEDQIRTHGFHLI
jgi:predicted small integral membrane protein